MNVEKVATDIIGVGKDAVNQAGIKTEGKIDIIKAEMNSDSQLTRLARPAIVFMGLFIILSEIFALRIGILLYFEAGVDVIRTSTTLVEFYLVTWSGVVSVYVFNRTKEKQMASSIIAQQRIDRKEQKVNIQHKRKTNRIERRNRRRGN